jgi:hypothetical protein
LRCQILILSIRLAQDQAIRSSEGGGNGTEPRVKRTFADVPGQHVTISQYRFDADSAVNTSDHYILCKMKAEVSRRRYCVSEMPFRVDLQQIVMQIVDPSVKRY